MREKAWRGTEAWYYLNLILKPNALPATGIVKKEVYETSIMKATQSEEWGLKQAQAIVGKSLEDAYCYTFRFGIPEK